MTMCFREWMCFCSIFSSLTNIDFILNWDMTKELHSYCPFKAADDDGNLQPVFLKRLYLLHICIFYFFIFNTSLTTI